jgi:hypothetical protein
MKFITFIVVTLILQSINLGLAEKCVSKGRIHMLATIMSWGYLMFAFSQGWEYVVAFFALSLYTGYKYVRAKEIAEEYRILSEEVGHEDHHIDEQGSEDTRLLGSCIEDQGGSQERGSLQ